MLGRAEKGHRSYRVGFKFVYRTVYGKKVYRKVVKKVRSLEL